MAVNCPAGKYCPSGTSGNQNACPIGYYCPANSRHPTPCPKGNYCPKGASTPTQCEAGFYCPDLSSQHTPCTPGFYCPVGAFAQLICSGNTFSAAQASVCSCISPPHGSLISTTPDCIITCDPGFSSYMGQCIPSMKPAQLTYLNADGTTSVVSTQTIAYVCPPCYSLQGSLCIFSITCTPTCPKGYVFNNNSVCTQCPSGKQSLNNQCVDADAGFYSSFGVEMACPAGTYSAPGATVCTLCPTGTSSAVIGATNSSTCTLCASGTYSASRGESSCTPCAKGTFSTSTGRTTRCTTQCRTSCPGGQYVTPACSAWADAGCSQCSSPSASQYVTAVCSGSTNTQFATFPSCNTGYYLNGKSSGTYATIGSGGSCQACAIPSGSQYGSQYVTGTCGPTTNTTITTKTCPAGNYLIGFFAGTYSAVGTAGTCTACSLPTGLQYVTGVCTPSADTQFGTKSTCSTGQYLSGFSAGTYNTVGTPGTCTTCSSPSAGQYVTTACSASSDTTITTKTCPAGNYLIGFFAGTYSAVGTAGTCTACSLPTGLQYVTGVCTPSADTQFGTKSTCSTGQYLSGFSAGTYNTVGTPGTCTTCSSPSAGQYVTTACSASSDTSIATRASCTAGQYLSGFSAGTSSAAGSAGTCTACSSPSGTQYVTGVCTPSADTQFGTKSTCSTGQYLSGFSAGTYNSIGSPGTCTTCSSPSAGQYVTTACSASSDTSIATRASCTAGQYLSGFSAGTSSAAGSAGTCTACSSPSGTQYVTGVCTPSADTAIATKTCSTGQYLSGFSAGSYISIGSAGTCTACSLPSGLQYVTGVCSMPSTDTTLTTRAECPVGQYAAGFSAGSYNSIGSPGTCTNCSTDGSSTCASCPPATAYWNGTQCMCPYNLTAGVCLDKVSYSGIEPYYLLKSGNATQDIGATLSTVANINTTDVSVCAAACRVNATCNGFMHNGTTCTFYNNAIFGEKPGSGQNAYRPGIYTIMGYTIARGCPSGYRCPSGQYKYACLRGQTSC